MAKSTGRLKSISLAFKTRKSFRRVLENYNGFGLTSQLGISQYYNFIRNFQTKRIGNFKLELTKGSADGSLILSIKKSILRKISSIHPKFRNVSFLKKLRIKKSNKLFKLKFILSKDLERNVKLPVDVTKGNGCCIVTNIIGPSKEKYSDSKAVVSEFSKEINDKWQNYLLGEIINYSRSQSCNSVALLRPEKNPDLSFERLKSKGYSESEIKSIHSQYYAAARKLKLKKVKGSDYFWLVF